jgi:hypothetical protein
MSHLQIPRPSLACILIGEWDTLDDDFTPSLTQPVRLSCALTRLVLQLDGEPASKFYLHGTNDNETFIISLCLPTAAITQIFSGELRGYIPRLRLRQHDRIHPPRRRRKPDHLGQKPKVRFPTSPCATNSRRHRYAPRQRRRRIRCAE